MAIDIKELRIGNHVLLDGERVEIDEISISGQIGCITQDSDWLGVDANDRLDPIPITEDLLTELGFEKNEDELQYNYIKRNEYKLNFFITLIDDNFIRIGVWHKTVWHGDFRCQYLHELENFVFMTTKKELI